MPRLDVDLLVGAGGRKSSGTAISASLRKRFESLKSHKSMHSASPNNILKCS